MREDFIAVTITGPTEEQLTELCRCLVTARLAACANIVPRIRSLYWWDNKVQDEAEAAAVLHTSSAKFDALIRAVQERHPYDVPQIVAFPINPSSTYGDWVRTATDNPPGTRGRAQDHTS